MPRRPVLAAALLVASVSAAGAQWYGPPSAYNAPPPPYGYGGPGFDRPLPRDVVVERLEWQGFEDVGRPRREGDTYVVTATSPAGVPVRVVVDAYRGVVLERSALRDVRGRELDSDEMDAPPPRRRSAERSAPSPFDEMPNAPRFRPDEPEAYGEPPPGRGAGRVQPAVPVEAVPLPPPAAPGASGSAASGSLARPADPRLAPEGDRTPATRPPAPQREASRPDPQPARPAATTAAPPSSGVYGLNPDKSRPADPARSSTAARERSPTAPATRPGAASSAPGVPAAPADAAKATAAKPAVTAASPQERKPVRVIPGVTPMTSGAQSSPAPQNNVAPPAPQAASD